MTHRSPGSLRLGRAPLVATLAVVAGVAVAACGGGTTPGATGTSTHGTGGGTGTTGATTSSTTSTTTVPPPPPPLPRGQQGTSAQIPWTDVGAGWTLAILNPSNESNFTTAGPRSLFVVDPAGGRYLVTSSLQKGEQIADWSGDSQRALLTDVSYSSVSAGPASTAVTEISLVDGTTLEQFTLGGQADLSFSRPRGLAILDPGLQSSTGQPGVLQRLSLGGSVELTFPSTFSQVGAYDGAAIYTPDGTAVVAGAAGGLALLSNSGGTVEQQIPVPVTGGCAPVKWWQTGVVLAACGTNLLNLGVAYGEAAWLVPLAGGSPTQLVPAMLSSSDGPIGLARTDVWEAGGDLYGVYAVACGATAVARVGPDSTATVLSVPGVTGNPDVLGAVGNRLVVEAIVSCDIPNHPNFALLGWNPATNGTSVLLGQPLTSGSVESAFLYPAAGNYP